MPDTPEVEAARKRLLRQQFPARRRLDMRHDAITGLAQAVRAWARSRSTGNEARLLEALERYDEVMDRFVEFRHTSPSA